MRNSKIEWTDHTFNPWWGCQRVSPGCEHCYAETLAHRYNFRVWGPAKTTERREMSANYWKQPFRWNRQAETEGRRARVFCASMADVFEDHPQIDDMEWRRRLWDVIEETPNLDWLLLTKRPQNVNNMVPSDWHYTHVGFPRNVWIGTSVEDQRRADERIPALLEVPARVRFLSCEPLLGALDIREYMECQVSIHGQIVPCSCRLVDWVICGGESGHGARPMHPKWARALQRDCERAGVPFFFKQWGQHEPVEFADGSFAFHSVGKARAGRLLNDKEWNEWPQ